MTEKKINLSRKNATFLCNALEGLGVPYQRTPNSLDMKTDEIAVVWDNGLEAIVSHRKAGL